MSLASLPLRASPLAILALQARAHCSYKALLEKALIGIEDINGAKQLAEELHVFPHLKPADTQDILRAPPIPRQQPSSLHLPKTPTGQAHAIPDARRIPSIPRRIRHFNILQDTPRQIRGPEQQPRARRAGGGSGVRGPHGRRADIQHQVAVALEGQLAGAWFAEKELATA